MDGLHPPSCLNAVVAGGFQSDTAARWVREGKADLIAFGGKFIANPELPERLRIGALFNADDPTTYYGGRREGIHRLSVSGTGSRRTTVGLCDQRWR